MALVEDLTPFFADFGEAGTLDGNAVRVIFDAPMESATAVPGQYATTPQVQIATASVPASVEGITLSLNRGAFIVRERVDDGTGLSLLLLSLAP